MEIVINVFSALLAAFLGGYFGAWFQHSFQNRNVNKVRKIAIKALDVFSRYAKQGQAFDKEASEFNNSLDVVEKRAILVALCKLGILVVKPINDLFQILACSLLQKVSGSNVSCHPSGVLHSW